MATILIVDDEPQIAGLLSSLLVREGHEVQTASNTQLANEMCSPPACFDLVLSEVSMPVMDGHELARWIADGCPNSRIVLISDSAMPCEECPYAPHCEIIPKPFDPKEILATVASVLAAPTPKKCMVAQLLSASYSAALKAFYGFPGIILEEMHSGMPGDEPDLKQNEAAYVALLSARADYWAHIHQHGCQQASMAIDTYEQIKNHLRRDLLEARTVLESASEKLERLALLSSELKVGSEAKSLWQRAKSVHHAAHQVYMLTLQRFTDFIRDEITPEERGGKPS